MVPKIVMVTLMCLAGMVAAQNYQTYPNQLYPVRPIAELPSPNAYEFHIVPSREVAEYQSPTELSIWDYIPSPSTALSCIASTALYVTTWILYKAPLIMLGMALVIGFCAFTPYCTLVIEKPFTRELRSLNIPYLDDMEHYLKQAYSKYHALQYED